MPDERVDTIPLLQDLLANGNNALLARDAEGVLRFHESLKNDRDLDGALDELEAQPQWSDAVARDRRAVLDLYETVFRHKSYTGRSGVMYGYEGLGCIYWHMVAKLLLAVQETILRADREGLSAPAVEQLAVNYFRIRAGLGHEKTVAEYGAFPTDPYSHTPPGGGAKQPGMTGQVKEEILTRFGELGVRVEGGVVRFRPFLLRADEFLVRPARFEYYDVGGRRRAIALADGNLAFTLCQVPVVYARVMGEPRVRVAFADGTSAERPGDALDARSCSELFARTGRIERIEVANPGP